MKSPNFVAVMQDGVWTCSYVGSDADKAKQAYSDAIAANGGPAMLFIRPEFTRRFRGAKPAPDPRTEATEPKLEATEPKPKKGGK